MNTQTQFSDLYNEFSGYFLKSKIEGYPHCELRSAENLLHKNDLTQLAWNDLQLFIANDNGNT